MPRGHIPVWLQEPPDEQSITDSLARKVLELLEKHGAMFTPDLEKQSGLLRPQLEQALKVTMSGIAAGMRNTG